MFWTLSKKSGKAFFVTILDHFCSFVRRDFSCKEAWAFQTEMKKVREKCIFQLIHNKVKSVLSIIESYSIKRSPKNFISKMPLPHPTHIPTITSSYTRTTMLLQLRLHFLLLQPNVSFIISLQHNLCSTMLIFFYCSPMSLFVFI